MARLHAPYRTTTLVSRTVGSQIVVVATPGQQLPELPIGVQVVEDPVEGLGPMRGIATGLAAVADRASCIRLSTDMPFLHPRSSIVCCTSSRSPTPMSCYPRRGVSDSRSQPSTERRWPAYVNLALGGELRPGMLFEHCRLQRIDEELLADAGLARFDADLESVMNLNTPDEDEAARARPPAEDNVQGFGALASAGRRGPRTVRAATLGRGRDS